ncbi:MAG: PAS domain S-box protein [Chloroflexi bacterium]|nr:PAS domain S-box protein [Chloroflexota bacterium]
MMTDAPSTLTDLGPGDHLCLLYADEYEHRTILTPFIRQGLERDEKVVCIVDADGGKTILGYLREDGLLVEPFIERGQFELLITHDAYMREGAFDPDQMIAWLESETRAALDHGYRALRVTSEMTWTLQDLPGSTRLIEYEAKLNQFFPNQRALAICQFDRRRFSAELLLDVLRTHPRAAIGATIHANPYFVPPEQLLEQRLAQATLVHWIEHLESRPRWLKEQARLKRATSAGKAALWEWDLATGILEWSGAIDDMLAYTPGEFPRTMAAWEDILHPDDRARVLDALNRHLQYDATYDIDYRVRRRDGAYVCWHDDGNCERDATGHAIRMTGSCVDITERKHAEIELRHSEEKLRNLIAQSKDGIVLVDSQGRVSEWNAEQEKISGLARADVIGRPIWEVQLLIALPEKKTPDISAMAEKMARAFLTGQQTRDLTVEMEIASADGAHRIIETKTFPIHTGDAIMLGSITREVTERKRTEDRLHRLNVYHRGLIEAGLDPLVTIMADGKIGDVNEATVLVTGYSRAELIGTDFADYFTEPDKARAGYQQVFIKGTVRDYELAIRHKDGHITPVLYTATVYRDENHQVAGVFAAARDMTERNRAEEELRRAMSQWQTTFDAIADSVCLLDHDSRIERCNAAVSKLLGKTTDEIIGQKCCQAVHDSPTPIPGCPFVRMQSSHQRETLDVMIGNGWYTSSIDPLFDDEGELIGGVHTLHDITERKRTEEKLRRANEGLDNSLRELQQRHYQSQILNEMGEMLQTCHTTDEAFAVIARFAQQLFPSETGALFMRHPTQELVEAMAIWGDLSSEEQVFSTRDCWAIRRNRVNAYGPTQNGLPCAHVKQSAQAYLCVPLFSQNELIGLLHLLTPGIPATTQEHEANLHSLAHSFAEHLALSLSNLKMQEILREQAVRDPLTGLHNRRYMEETLERELRRAARSQRPLSIVTIDLDHLKDINDQFGHEMGDEALRQFGNLIKSSIRGADVACRFGGDEFILILAEAELENARQRAEELHRATHELVVQYLGQTVNGMSMSAGIAACPTHGVYPQSILRAADAALYRAKTAGRNRVVVAETPL